MECKRLKSMEALAKGEDIHNHCLGCIKISKCTVRPQNGESCEIVVCDLDCGARFHSCKKSEHKLLCPNERVSCINAEYGCSSMMLRKYRGMHLNKCPASVIYCTMEWNRWPVPINKGPRSQQCEQQVFHKPQLDVALAMRDQRMLRRQWEQLNPDLKDDSSVQCPTLPFHIPLMGRVCEAEAPEASGQTAQSSEDNKISLELVKSKSGQQQMFCGEPSRASKQVAEISNATSMITSHTGYNFEENAKRDSSLQFSMDSVEASILPNEENKENIMDYVNNSTSVNHFSSVSHGHLRERQRASYDPLTMITSHSGYNFPENADSDSSLQFSMDSVEASILPNEEEKKENVMDYVNNSTSNNYGSEKTNHHFTPMDMSPPVSTEYFQDLDVRNDINCDLTYEKDSEVVYGNDTVISDISSDSILDYAQEEIVLSPASCPLIITQPSISLWYPSSVPPWCASLGLDLNFESVTRYKPQSESMYTFLCAQEFRRDEYAWHYKNVHSEIHGGLNGWLEERCPLAQYGCTFGRRRFYPAPKGSSIVHNEILESFGVKFPTHIVNTSNNDKIESQRYSSCTKEFHQNSLISGSFPKTIKGGESSSCDINITQLPFEVLQHIAGFLDSFSLCNFSLTSRLLRDVCLSLLEERGIVAYSWERKMTPKGISWKVASKRWFFSSSFSPIRQWCFEEGKNMSDHLKTCAYFNKNIKSDPYYYPMGLEPNQNTYQKLKNSMAETTQSGLENITTKL